MFFFSHGFLRKYKEIFAPRVEKICCITNNTYDKAEIWHLVVLKEPSYFQIVFIMTDSDTKHIIVCTW